MMADGDDSELPAHLRTVAGALARTVARVPDRPFVDVDGLTLSSTQRWAVMRPSLSRSGSPGATGSP